VDRFLYKKEILIDDSGWGDLILGVVIGALKLPDRRYMERRIPVSSFQTPNFQNKKYLNDAVKIAEEIVDVMQPDSETIFRVCSGYVLISIRKYLRDQRFRVEEIEEVGAPVEGLEGKRNFNTFFEWVAEKPHLREKLVKTGWKSWNQRWREKAYQIHLGK
jgi:hypothetical protein